MLYSILSDQRVVDPLVKELPEITLGFHGFVLGSFICLERAIFNESLFGGQRDPV
jgi:hypothetical protein